MDAVEGTSAGTKLRAESFSQDEANKYPMGYVFTDAGKRRMRIWVQTSVIKSSAAAIGDLSSILVLAAMGALLLHVSTFLGCLSYPFIVILIGRQLRGCENMVHEGGHYNICRRHHRLNDAIANCLSAYPVFSTVQGFRGPHNPDHHLGFGGPLDPCRPRFVGPLGFEELVRSSFAPFVSSIGARIIPYASGWWTGPSGISLGSVARGGLWHLLVVLVPLSMFLGFIRTLSVWCAFFVVPFLVVLPVLRFVAEAGEHHYLDSDGTVFSASFNNTGRIHWLFHPHADGLHVVHHLCPEVPHHRLREVDAWLAANEPAYAACRRRTSLLDEPPAARREATC